ncbi:MAG: DUF1987 domain-containing protein [Bacteroidales bacterium]|nr:DUF1987 domain-containing protein [Bacteroidales bacterium]
MTDFIINPKVNYPFILTDASKGLVYISGISIPENAVQFYIPLIAWIDDYLTSLSNSLTVNFEMLYFGNSSSKAFFDLFQLLDKHHKNGKQIKVNWFYHPDDNDIMEDGEEFADLFNLPFTLQEKPITSVFSFKKTSNSPLVYFDQSGDVIIEGPSTNGKPWKYYYPIIMWLDTIRFSLLAINIKVDIYLSKIDKLNLYYINTIIKELELIDDNVSKQVQIVWKYPNNEIKAIGEDVLLKSTIPSKFEKIEQSE